MSYLTHAVLIPASSQREEIFYESRRGAKKKSKMKGRSKEVKKHEIYGKNKKET